MTATGKVRYRSTVDYCKKNNKKLTRKIISTTEHAVERTDVLPGQKVRDPRNQQDRARFAAGRVTFYRGSALFQKLLFLNILKINYFVF